MHRSCSARWSRGRWSQDPACDLVEVAFAADVVLVHPAEQLHAGRHVALAHATPLAVSSSTAQARKSTPRAHAHSGYVTETSGRAEPWKVSVVRLVIGLACAARRGNDNEPRLTLWRVRRKQSLQIPAFPEPATTATRRVRTWHSRTGRKGDTSASDNTPAG